MEKVINSYETMFIVDLDAGETAVKAEVDKFTGLISANAELVEVTEWGKRRLAYPINDKPEGYYVVASFKSEPAFPSELERNYKNDEAIMRSLTVKLEFEAVKHEKPMIAEEVSFSSDDEPVAEKKVEEEAAPVAEEAPAVEEAAPVEEAPATETAE